MSESINKYGLIGYPLSHSFSPAYFKEKFSKEGITDASYQIFELEDISQLCALIAESNLRGLNVTIPHKKSVLSYMDELDPLAESISSVNTIVIEDNTLKGYNTDVIGFELALKKFINDLSGISALILGTGGASAAVSFVLNKLDIDHLFVSRSNASLTYDQLTKQHILDHKLIINTTPLGMYPNVDKKPPLHYDAITDNHYLFDLIYNPEKTLFLKEGEQKNAKVENGLEMLKLQAEASWNIWNNKST